MKMNKVFVVAIAIVFASGVLSGILINEKGNKNAVKGVSENSGIPFYNKLVEYAEKQGKTVEQLTANWTAEDWIRWYKYEGNPSWGSTNITDTMLATDWIKLPNSGNITWGADYDYEYKYNATSDRLEMYHNGTLVSYLDSDDLWHYVSDRPNFTDIHHIIDKEYIDFAVASLGARYYMVNTSSGISDYKLTQLSPPSGSEESITKTGLTDNEYIAGWISPSANEPNKLIKGVYNWHIYAEKTGGTKTLRLYWKLVERKSDNSEVVIATSVASNEIVSSKNYYVLPLFLNEDYELADGSYVVGKLYADVSGGGSSPSVTIYFNGDTESHWEIPVNLEIFSNTFLKLNGSNANTDIDVSPYNFTAGNISAFNLKSSASYIVWRNGSTYYARNGTTGEIEFKSTNASWVIQQSVDKLSNGGEIYIKHGIYNISNKITIWHHGIRIVGEGRGQRLTSPPIDYNTILRFTTDISDGLFKIYDDDATPGSDYICWVEISNIDIDGNGYSGIGINIERVKDVKLSDLYIHDIVGHAIKIDRCNGGVLENSHIEDCGDTTNSLPAVYIDDTTGISTIFRFINNIFEPCDYGWIHQNLSASSISKGIIISNNWFEDDGSKGEHGIITGERWIITNNIFAGSEMQSINKTHIIVGQAWNIISGNIFFYGSRAGVSWGSAQIWITISGDNTIISNNLFYQADGVSIRYESGVYDVQIVNNYFKDCDYSAIYSAGDYIYRSIIKDNIFVKLGNAGTGYAVRLLGDYNTIEGNKIYISDYGVTIAGGNNNVIKNNEFYSISNTVINDVGTNTVIRNNIGYTTENSGSAEITGDGSKTFYISHGLATTPTWVDVTPTNSSMASAMANGWFWNQSATNSTVFAITFTTAPSNGDKLSFVWEARVD